MIERSLVIGRWSLRSHGFRRSNGEFVPTAQEMTGRLIYSSDGSMSVLITKKSDPINASDMIAYSGYFTITESGMYHHVEVSPDFHRVGQKEHRLPSLDKDQLTLKTIPSLDGYYEIVWQRIHPQ